VGRKLWDFSRTCQQDSREERGPSKRGEGFGGPITTCKRGEGQKGCANEEIWKGWLGSTGIAHNFMGQKGEEVKHNWGLCSRGALGKKKIKWVGAP